MPGREHHDAAHTNACCDERDGRPTGPFPYLEVRHRRSFERRGFHGDLDGLYRFPRDGGFAPVVTINQNDPNSIRLG